MSPENTVFLHMNCRTALPQLWTLSYSSCWLLALTTRRRLGSLFVASADVFCRSCYDVIVATFLTITRHSEQVVRPMYLRMRRYLSNSRSMRQ